MNRRNLLAGVLSTPFVPLAQATPGALLFKPGFKPGPVDSLCHDITFPHPSGNWGVTRWGVTGQVTVYFYFHDAQIFEEQLRATFE